MSTRDRIFEAAVHLFAARGFHGTSIRDIARDVGIKESSIYNHYRGKDAILEAVLQYQMDGFREAAASLEVLKDEGYESSDPVEFWMTGTRVFVAALRPLADTVSRVIINEMYLNETCRRFVLESLFAARKQLTEGIFRGMYEMGLIRDCDFAMAAEQYVCMLQGLEIENALETLEGRDAKISLEKTMEHMTFFIEGLKE